MLHIRKFLLSLFWTVLIPGSIWASKMVVIQETSVEILSVDSTYEISTYSPYLYDSLRKSDFFDSSSWSEKRQSRHEAILNDPDYIWGLSGWKPESFQNEFWILEAVPLLFSDSASRNGSNAIDKCVILQSRNAPDSSRYDIYFEKSSHAKIPGWPSEGNVTSVCQTIRDEINSIDGEVLINIMHILNSSLIIECVTKVSDFSFVTREYFFNRDANNEWWLDSLVVGDENYQNELCTVTDRVVYVPDEDSERINLFNSASRLKYQASDSSVVKRYNVPRFRESIPFSGVLPAKVSQLFSAEERIRFWTRLDSTGLFLVSEGNSYRRIGQSDSVKIYTRWCHVISDNAAGAWEVTASWPLMSGSLGPITTEISRFHVYVNKNSITLQSLYRRCDIRDIYSLHENSGWGKQKQKIVEYHSDFRPWGQSSYPSGRMNHSSLVRTFEYHPQNN